MDDSLHPKNCERGKFKVTNVSNKTTKLIHQMWDEMATMIVIKKDNKMVTTFETIQTNVEGSSMIKVPQKQKKEPTIRKKGRR